MPQINPIYILIAAGVLALLVAWVLAFPVIALLRQKKLGQQIRDDGPQRHLTKAGTPTMGGVVIMAGLVCGVLASWPFLIEGRRATLAVLLLTLALAVVGSIDDWGKISKGRSLGLRAREKLIGQLGLSAAFVAVLVLGLHRGTTIGIPGVGTVELGLAYWPLAILYITGISNAVNLTDGLDGLAGGVSAVVCFALAAIAWVVPGVGHATAIFLACLGAACLAFLWFNRHPARVFMGDTGSLAIGAALAGAALVIKQEVALLLLGMVYLVEVGSVIIQVIAFKTTGKRVFRMSPFHHHLELCGWSEPRIVATAWGVTALLGVLAVAWAR